jgi:hypothetical protein
LEKHADSQQASSADSGEDPVAPLALLRRDVRRR